MKCDLPFEGDEMNGQDRSVLYVSQTYVGSSGGGKLVRAIVKMIAYSFVRGFVFEGRVDERTDNRPLV